MDKHPVPTAPVSQLETAEALANGLEALNLLRPLLIIMRQQIAMPNPDLAQLNGLCQAAGWIADEYHHYLDAMWREETRNKTTRS
ncbi:MULTISPECIES: hypothetical protein [Chromobacterium]|uniref:Uncharacterized protein n=1 Tax=Chromobacterium rhizoryzae TaxID=1778675 RepID=A0AAD0RQL7_9NEIS|nr:MULTISPECIES: hypothetical protein [Chromobacterium]AXT45934.1 hypothetical protein D1345_06960 [Chromobacterium rhizoryzae]KMN82120.1 hypothetical protein VK98_09600 [Chromobacterium sp. LK11]MDH0344292.1 hypothetical protein [Chromobacterium haemolyticum]